jgi:hypothetical protein
VSEELRKFRRPRFAPPGGAWFYQVKETGLVFESHQGFDDLEFQVRRHLKSNNLPVPENLRAVIEDALCRHMPKGVCFGDDDRPMHEIVPTFFEASAAMEAFFRGKAIPHCTLQEAEDRIRSCIGCKCNNLRLCTSCDGLKARAKAFVNDRSTKFDAHAGVCMVHRIPVNALVHVKNVEAKPGAPPNCWVKHA